MVAMGSLSTKFLHLLLILALNYVCSCAGSMKHDGGGLKLQPDDHTVRQLPAKQAQQVGVLLAGKNFSLSVQLVQAAGSDGALLHVRTGDHLPVLDFASDGPRHTLTLKIKGFDGEDKVISGSATLTDGLWHRIILEINSHMLFIVVDCEIVSRASSDNLDFSSLIRGTPQFFIAQRPQAADQLVGTLREFSADRHSYIRQHCPKLDVDRYNTFHRPTTSAPSTLGYHIGHFASFDQDYLTKIKRHELEPTTTTTSRPAVKVTASSSTTMTTTNGGLHVVESTDGDKAAVEHPIHKELNNLKDKVGFLETQFRHWRDIVTRYENQLKHVQLHQRGCQLNDLLLADGQTWTNETACVRCVCSRGTAHCGPIGCAPLPCAHPVMRPDHADGSGDMVDRCCPMCAPQCDWNGGVYEHGEVFYPKTCTRCTCSHGLVSCAHVRPTDCPALSCPVHKQRTPPDQCCPVCDDHDHCAERPCHLNATCVNGRYDRTCTCKEGFFGNGLQCYDVDECKSPPPNLKGCGKGSRCVNTVGSFECHCFPGYAQVDKVTCIDLLSLRK